MPEIMHIELKEKILKQIADIIAENNIEAYVIGGYVRDIFLNRESKDIDIVTIGSGIELAQLVAKKLGCINVNYFKNFGTAMLHFDDIEVEFVGARKESYDRTSRKPIVEDGTFKDDQLRRDFTINAMAISLNRDNLGELIDPFNGIADLKNKLLRTPLDPEITFSDDPLRMIRAIRFASQLNFTIDEIAIDAIKNNVDRIRIVSNERIVDEINKIILSKEPSIGFLLLDKTNLLPLIFPELEALKGVDTLEGKAHKDNFYHTLKVLDNISLKSDDLWLRWAAILHDIGKAKTKKFHKKQGWTFHGHDALGGKMVVEIFKRLKLPQNQKMKYVQKLVQLHLRPISLVESIVTDSAVRRLLFDASDDINDLMTLCEADITSKNEEKLKTYLNNFKLVREKLKEVEEKDHIRQWEPPISGELIMETFGISPCKHVGDIKNAIKNAILDGEIKNNYESAYEFMIKLGKEIGLRLKNV
ncbi:MAG: tRNA nucleotidyltransferase [Bacteroidetes bacterium RIFOXYA12_FULL_33_9]|nr:MAG: tRNA nucleotidyltransferase [Bacteroidetes bacterium RIFOXYA12_FULL_33_9]